MTSIFNLIIVLSASIIGSYFINMMLNTISFRHKRRRNAIEDKTIIDPQEVLRENDSDSTSLD